MVYVPSYMGNVVKNTEDAGTNQGQKYPSYSDVSIQQVLEIEEMPIRMRSKGLWDIQVQIQGEG